MNAPRRGREHSAVPPCVEENRLDTTETGEHEDTTAPASSVSEPVGALSRRRTDLAATGDLAQAAWWERWLWQNGIGYGEDD